MTALLAHVLAALTFAIRAGVAFAAVAVAPGVIRAGWRLVTGG